MKRCLLILMILIFVAGTTNKLKAQFYQFSQFYSAPLILAPSFAGMTEASRLAMNYRKQWVNVPGAFQTYAVSYDQYFPKMHSGFGLKVLRDQAGSGDLALTQVGMAYSYNAKINRLWYFRPGLEFSFSQRSLDFHKLIFADQLINPADPAPISIEQEPDNQKAYIDFAASSLIFSKMYWFGITAENLLKPNQSLVGDQSQLSMKFSAYGGIRFFLVKNERRRQQRKRNDQSISITFLYRNKVYTGDQLDIGFYWQKDPFVLGAWFRGLPVFNEGVYAYEKVDAVVLLAGIKSKRLSIGYSYDFTISKLINSTGGSHEISLIYEFNRSLKMDPRKRKEAIPCPMF